MGFEWQIPPQKVSPSDEKMWSRTLHHHDEEFLRQFYLASLLGIVGLGELIKIRALEPSRDHRKPQSARFYNGKASTLLHHKTLYQNLACNDVFQHKAVTVLTITRSAVGSSHGSSLKIQENISASFNFVCSSIQH